MKERKCVFFLRYNNVNTETQNMSICHLTLISLFRCSAMLSPPCIPCCFLCWYHLRSGFLGVFSGRDWLCCLSCCCANRATSACRLEAMWHLPQSLPVLLFWKITLATFLICSSNVRFAPPPPPRSPHVSSLLFSVSFFINGFFVSCWNELDNSRTSPCLSQHEHAQSLDLSPDQE